MAWIEIIQKWWWLITIGLGLIVTLYRYSIRIHKATEELKQVSKHDSDIQKIWEKTEKIEGDTKELKTEMAGMRESLEKHSTDQKSDISTMMDVLFSILDFLQDGSWGDKDGTVRNAHKRLRQRTLDK